MSFQFPSIEVMSSLAALGLKPEQRQVWLDLQDPRLPFRVAAAHRGFCSVISCSESLSAPGVQSSAAEIEPAAGQALDARLSADQSVAVGDWVLLQRRSDEVVYVDRVLPRRTWLRRAGANDCSQEQLIASNLDTVFVVCARAPEMKADQRALNTRRLERFLWLVREGGANAVVLLNKTDLNVGAEPAAASIARDLGGVLVQPVCAHTGQGMDRLEPYLGCGESVGFIGSSGVGKSTLINRILGEQRLATGEARSQDAKGRHTTTRRQLVRTPAGALLIDTPGMREVALFSLDGGAVGFEDVQALAQGCRFSDCEHDRELGCAVTAAIEQGTLPAIRLQNFRSMARDAERQASRHDAYARHVAHQQVRQMGRRVREATLIKRRG